MDMIVRLAGEIDCATGPAVQADLLRTVSEHRADVVADLGEVTFLDCAGLGALVAVRVWAAEHGLRFRVTRPAPAVRRLLDAAGPETSELLLSGDGDSSAAAAGDFCPEPQPGTLSGGGDTGHRLEAVSEQLRIADEGIRVQQELIDQLARGRAADRSAVVRIGAALPVPRPDGDESDGTPLARFVLAPRGRSGAASDATLLAAVGAAARLSTVDTDLETALSRLAELAAEGLAPALRVSIVVGPPAEPEITVTTDRAAQVADGEQHRTGSGPSWDAYETGRPVAAATLHSDERWPALRGPAPAGADGVAAVPLVRASAGTAGVLTVYGTAALAEDTQVGRATLFADAAAALLREHSVIAELRLQEAQLREALTSRATIDQAKGILMALHGIDAEAAFAELVRRSQHRNIKLREVARQLVAEASSGASARVRRAWPAPSAVSPAPSAASSSP
jgi:anti-anti-sigma factor